MELKVSVRLKQQHNHPLNRTGELSIVREI
jgi:hypothetical protein